MIAETTPSDQPIERILPNKDLVVDFGEPASGFAHPMPPERRAWYAERVCNPSTPTNGERMAELLSTPIKMIVHE